MGLIRTPRDNPKLRPDFKLQERDLDVLASFDTFSMRPTNWMQADFGGGNGLSDRLTDLTAHGFLERFTWQRIVNRMNLAEPMTYIRTEKGDELLVSKGRDILPLHGKRDREKCLVDIIKQSTMLGAREHGLQVLFRREILTLPDKPAYLREIGHSPKHKAIAFHLGSNTVYADDFPHIVLKDGKGFAIYDEMERVQKNITVLDGKLQAYAEIWRKKLWKEQHGFNRALLRITVTNEVRRQNYIKRCLEVLGPTPWILWGLIEDHTSIGRRQDVTTRFLTEAYPRAGLPDFSILEMK